MVLLSSNALGFERLTAPLPASVIGVKMRCLGSCFVSLTSLSALASELPRQQGAAKDLVGEEQVDAEHHEEEGCVDKQIWVVRQAKEGLGHIAEHSRPRILWREVRKDADERDRRVGELAAPHDECIERLVCAERE